MCLRVAENLVEKLMEHVLSGHCTISQRTGTAVGTFQTEIKFASPLCLSLIAI